MIKKPFLSIIIPVYNETKRLNNLLSLCNFFRTQKFKTELIVVNDGSIDDTFKKLVLLQRKIKFHIISYPKNKGKGCAIKTGMLSAHGNYCLFTDIDLSTPVEEFSKFIPFIKKYDVVIGSRKMKGSNLITHQPWIRENLGKCFTELSRYILNLDHSDFTCGFKCFSNKAAKQIFSRQKVKRWGFDSEILFIAKTKGFKIKEIPVKWSNDVRTRVKFPQDLIISLVELFQIRYNHFRNYYK